MYKNLTKQFLKTCAALAATLLVSTQWAHAALSPEVSRGISWLQTQVTADGGLSNESSSVATPHQNRTESAITLKKLGTLPTSLVTKVNAETESNTEYLARRALVLNIAGLDNTQELENVAANQSWDGGFGGTFGLESNVSDTSRVLLAYVQSGKTSSQAVAGARFYLLNQVQADGGMPGATDTYRLNQTALALSALQTVASDTATAAAVQKLVTWLLQKQEANGGWGSDSYITSLVWAALQPNVSDQAIRTNANNYLLQVQSADGSWNGDPFVTALALRALSYDASSSGTSPTPTPGSIFGKLVDQATSAALAGATVSLTGQASTQVQSQADGTFTINGLQAGSYSLQIAKEGYTGFLQSYALNSGQSLNIGSIGLSQVATTGIVKGKILQGGTGQPLAGVNVTVSGTNVLSAVTDANGLYEINNIQPGDITIFASAQGYTTISGTAVMAGGATLVFSPSLYPENDPNAPTTGHFVGQVVAAGSGTSLVGATIQLNGTAVGVTGANGQFNFELAPGNYHAVISMAGYDSATANFLMSAGATISTGQVALTKQLSATTIRGLVTDSTTGNAIPGATLQVIDGNSYTSGSDGAYAISGLTGNTFTLRVSATGYVSQSLQFNVSRPAEISYDFKLLSQTASALDLTPLVVSPASVGSMADVTTSTTIRNQSASGDPMSGILFVDIKNAQGEIVSSGAAYDATGANVLGMVSLSPGQTVQAILRWNSGQFAPGTYTIVARLSEAGSVIRANPRGFVLDEQAGVVTITEQAHFTGTITADPPVLRTQTNTVVHLSAILQNDGNVVLPSQTYSLQIVNTTTNAVAHSQSISGDSMVPGAMLSLTFADWIPTVGANYRVDLSSSVASQGKVSGNVYVGDAATGNFTVSKTVVPVGTQTIKANIRISGQDVAQGTISDPLAPLIKTAVQKAVTYNDPTAVNWTLSNKCLGCHVSTQALVGGELTRGLTVYSTANRRTLLNALSTNLQSSGAIYASHPEYQRTQTMLGLWALNASHIKDELVSTLVRAASYVVGIQESSGRWTRDHDSGWWSQPSANTAFNVKSLIDVTNTLKQAPQGTAVNFDRLTWLNSASINGTYYFTTDADSNLYVSSYNAQAVTKISPDGTMLRVMSNIPQAEGIVRAADGTIYVASQQGIFKSNSAGTNTKISTTSGTGLVLGADGYFYTSDYWNNRIMKVAPDGTSSVYLSGGSLSRPLGLAFDSNGDLLVANYGNSKILRIKPNKTVEEAVSWVPGQPRNIVSYGDGWLVGSTGGLYSYNSNMEGERLLFTSVEGVAYTPDGRIVVGDGGQSIFKVNKTEIDKTARIAAYDGAITKGVNWLLADTTYNANSNLDLAHRLIGFGAAKEYYAGTAKEATLQTKMDQIAATLRSRQRTDGGWGATTSNGSDSMVTAQVGVALDYMNPSAKDPIVQNAIKYLLSRQQSDGSWLSENNILSTHLAATTWVAIWLPIALDRIGGIDADLSVTMPANVTMANPSIAPTSSQAGANGSTTYIWKLQGVTSDGRDVAFDATLANMAVNEVRPVALDAHLEFTNTFTQGKVNAPIAVPSITGSAYMSLDVGTDKVQYGPNEAVTVWSLVSNLSDAVNGGSVQLDIYAADKVLVKNLGTLAYPSIAAKGQQTQTSTWNTGVYQSGGYYAQATLFDAQNHLVGTATSLFNIVSGITGSNASAKISVDKVTYQPYDSVRVLDRITNLAKNTSLDELQAVTTLYGPAGDAGWTTTSSLGQIVAGDHRDLNYSVPLVNAPAGSYRAVLLVVNSAGSIVATSETSFSVQSTADTGSGLKGSIVAEPKLVPQGDAALLSETVQNSGNAALNGLPLTLSVVDPANQQVLVSWPQTVNVEMGQQMQSAFSLATDNLPVGATYVAVLTAVVGGKTVTLAQDSIAITEPPVKLGVSQSVKPAARVLVLLSCHEAQGVTNNSGTVDPAANQACLANRTVFVDQYLTALGISHRIVVDDETFRDALRSGSYNTYWISGGREKLHESIAEEVREAVFRGDGLILDGVHDQRNKVLNEAAGIVYRGKLNPTALPMTANGSLFGTGTYATQGRALSLLLVGSAQQAVFGGSPTDGISKSGTTYPAIVNSQFGQGHTLTYAFDLVASLQAQPASDVWKSLVLNGVGYVTPVLPSAYSGRDFWTLHTDVANLEREVDLAITTRLPSGSIFLSSQPASTMDASGNPVWNIRLPAGAVQPLDLTLRLPSASGSYRVETIVDWVRDGIVRHYGDYVWNVDVGAALDSAATWPAEISNLAVNSSEKEARDKAASYLNDAISLAGWSRYDEAFSKLIASVESLRKITSLDISAPRLKIDRLLKEVEYHTYCSSAAIRPAECGQ